MFSAEAFFNGLPFIRALRAFNAVVHCCFGSVLIEGWQQAITEFTVSYTALRSCHDTPISITPKVSIFITWFFRTIGTCKQPGPIVPENGYSEKRFRISYNLFTGPYCYDSCEAVSGNES